jgi:quercetin dioxygenase-like cupin family protein
MPIILEPKDLTVVQKHGANSAVLADYSKIGTNALQVERIELDVASRTALYGGADAERFIYVIRGNGQSYVGDQSYPLEAESVLWLEKEDTFYLEAGSDGLEILLCHAPAGD